MNNLEINESNKNQIEDLNTNEDMNFETNEDMNFEINEDMNFETNEDMNFETGENLNNNTYNDEVNDNKENDNKENLNNNTVDDENNDNDNDIKDNLNNNIVDDNNKDNIKEKNFNNEDDKSFDITDDMDIDELINDFSKFSEKEEKKKKQIELMLELFRLLGYHIYEQNDLLDIMIMREKLLEKKTNKLLLDKVPELKKVYNTGYLSCLHDNSIYKQKWPAINLLRQILKCNFYQLTPKILSNGYDKLSGKKQVTRVFVIEKILY